MKTDRRGRLRYNPEQKRLGLCPSSQDFQGMDGCSQRWVLTTLKGVSPVSGDTPLFVVRFRRSHPLRLSLGGSPPRVARLCLAGKCWIVRSVQVRAFWLVRTTGCWGSSRVLCRQWDCMSTALTCLRSMVLVRSRTASMRESVQRFLTARRTPSAHAGCLFRQHCLYLRPLPHGQGSLRPVWCVVRAWNCRRDRVRS